MNNNCFAYSSESCTVLCSKRCGNCKFFKTTVQYEEDRAKAMERIASLPWVERKRIADTYYRGKTPNAGLDFDAGMR